MEKLRDSGNQLTVTLITIVIALTPIIKKYFV